MLELRSGRLCVLVICTLLSSCGAFAPVSSTPLSQLQRPMRPACVAQLTEGDVRRDSPPLSDMELAEQTAKLEALAAKWERRQEEIDYAESLRSGWGPSPERINGRFAMFFFVVALVTEYYTGQSTPQQVYTLLQTLSIIDVRAFLWPCCASQSSQCITQASTLLVVPCCCCTVIDGLPAATASLIAHLLNLSAVTFWEACQIRPSQASAHGRLILLYPAAEVEQVGASWL